MFENYIYRGGRIIVVGRRVHTARNPSNTAIVDGGDRIIVDGARIFTSRNLRNTAMNYIGNRIIVNSAGVCAPDNLRNTGPIVNFRGRIVIIECRICTSLIGYIQLPSFRFCWGSNFWLLNRYSVCSTTGAICE